jgi:hypothetical protein
MSNAIPLAFALNSQPDIHDAGTRSDNEVAAFSEMREVLKKYGLEAKYGLTLLHKHFDLDEDEVLVEYTDIENRTLTSKPTKIGMIPSHSLIETTWALDKDVVMGHCMIVCFTGGNGHVGQHRPAGA